MRGIATGIWKSRVMTWKLEHLALAPGLLEPSTGQYVNAAVMSFPMRLPPIPNFTTNDYYARIQNFLAILRATRRLPHPPILLRVGPLLEVLDGTHRLAALFIEQANGIPVEPTHDAWVASPGFIRTW